MMGEDLCRQTFAGNASSDFALVEGVIGLFDGKNGVGGPGSTVDIARVLDIPIWLVVDAKGMSGSIVPLVKGFVAEAKRAGAKITGIFGNRLGNAYHAKPLQDLLNDNALPPMLAWLEKGAPILPERQLGQAMPGETTVPNFQGHLHTDLEQLLSNSHCIREVAPVASIETPLLKDKLIAIARDAACCFIYPANLRWLTMQGASLHFFSPLKGESIPEQCDAVWLPGGYPELHAETLSVSPTWNSLAQHIQANKPVLAECGGMMLLGKQLVDHETTVYTMADILPFETHMQNRLAGLGFRQDARGARGHEFHHSTREPLYELPAAFKPQKGDGGMY